MGLGSEWEVADSRILWGSIYGLGFGIVVVVMVHDYEGNLGHSGGDDDRSADAAADDGDGASDGYEDDEDN